MAGALVLLAGSGGQASERVLTERAAETVQQLLRLSEPLGPDAPLDARIEKDRVVVTAGPEGAPLLAVTLVHEDAAPEDAPRAAGLAILMTPGPAPETLVAALRARMLEGDVRLPWIELSPGRSGSDDPTARAESGSGPPPAAATDGTGGAPATGDARTDSPRRLWALVLLGLGVVGVLAWVRLTLPREPREEPPPGGGNLG